MGMWPVVKLVLKLVMQLVTYTFSHPWIAHGQRYSMPCQ